MNKFGHSFLLACLLWLVGTAPSLGSSFDSLDRIVNQIDSMFPPLEGVVISVDRQILTLDLKQGQPVKQGDRLKLIRFGNDIIHPISKKKIGRKETDLGEVEIIEVRQDFSLAKLIDPTTLARPSDGIRSPFNELTFLVATPKTETKKSTVDRNLLRMQIEEKLAKHPRFQIPSFDLDLWLLENNLSTKDMLKSKHLDKLKSQIKADYLLVSSIGSIKRKLVLSYKLYSAQTGRLKKQAKILSDQFSGPYNKRSPLREQEVQRSFSPSEDGLVEYVGKQEFKFKIVDLDIGDINGDGLEELVVATPNRIIVYDFRNNKLKQVSTFRAKNKNHKFISVDVGDINKNGRDEIFVTDHLGSSLSSFVLEGRRGRKGLQKIWDEVNLYFRIIHPFGKKPVLLTQAPGYTDPFHGPISKMIYKKRSYLPSKKINLPSIPGIDFILYGLTLADINGDNKNEIVILDEGAHLRVYNREGRVLVQSNEYFGRDPRQIEVGVREGIPGVTREGEPVQYRGRLSFIRHGAKRYLLVPKIHSSGGRLLPGVTINPRSSMTFLNLTREGLQKTFEMKKQRGYIGGYGVLKAQKNSPKSLHMATIDEKSGLKGRIRSTIYSYFLKK
jgi:hypothetical protein